VGSEKLLKYTIKIKPLRTKACKQTGARKVLGAMGGGGITSQTKNTLFQGSAPTRDRSDAAFEMCSAERNVGEFYALLPWHSRKKRDPIAFPHETVKKKGTD